MSSRTIVLRSVMTAALLVFGTTSMSAQTSARTAPPPPPKVDTVAVRPLAITPAPSTVRPRGTAASQLPPTAPVIIPMASPSAPPPARSAAPVAPALVPEPIARAVPRSPVSASMTSVADAVLVPADSRPPSGSTMRCKDGTFLSVLPSDRACDGNGGVSVVYPQRDAAPTPPSPARRP